MSAHIAFLRCAFPFLLFPYAVVAKSAGADVHDSHTVVRKPTPPIVRRASPHHPNSLQQKADFASAHASPDQFRAPRHRQPRYRRIVAVEPGATLTVPSFLGGSILDRGDFMQVPLVAAVAAATPPVTAAPPVATPVAAAPPVATPGPPMAAAPPIAAVATAAPAVAAAPPIAAVATAAPPAVAVATAAPAVAAAPPLVGIATAAPPVAAAPPAGNATAAPATSQGGPPYIQGPMKIFVYGFFFAFMYLAVWYARLPAEKRPAAVDEGMMRWFESQEEDDPSGAMNCILVRIKSATGLPPDKQPASISVECAAFKKELNIGQTDFESNGVFDTCFVGPLVDLDEKNRTVTMAAAKPTVKFIVKHQAPGASKAIDFAQAVMRPGSDAASSSSAAPSGGGGLTRGEWCVVDLKLLASASGAMGVIKRVAAGSVGTLSVEVKAMQVNSAGKALLKSRYTFIALRNEFKKPYSACARTLAVALMGMLAITSLPLIGDMFNGCFYLSCHGLTTSSTLFCMSVPHWAKLFQVPLPKWVNKMSIDSLKTGGVSLMSMGCSGVWTALWWGRGAECTDHFWSLEILLCVDSLLFCWAWWKGEGGGLMGLING